jgi:hypothetical protein
VHQQGLRRAKLIAYTSLRAVCGLAEGRTEGQVDRETLRHMPERLGDLPLPDSEDTDFSPALDEVRNMLWPGLPVDEGRARVEAAITGAADIETWKRIEEIAAAEPDLFAHLFAALKERRQS